MIFTCVREAVTMQIFLSLSCLPQATGQLDVYFLTSPSKSCASNSLFGFTVRLLQMNTRGCLACGCTEAFRGCEMILDW